MSAPTAHANSNTGELPKAYKPSEHEDRVWQRWIEAGAFRAHPGRVLSGERKPYAIFIPPPNVTAALHLGHALNNTLQDVLIRRKRMQGFEALWMPGTDHAGIATQAVVEKRVMKEEKKRKTDFTREQFVAKIQAFKDEYEKVITGQLQKMGCSCDWDRQRFTMDEQCAAAVREAFFILFRDGLIYRGKRLVNWDPALQTAVADDECYDEEIDGAFYYLRYPLVHALALEPGTPRAGHGNGHSHDVDPKPVTWDELAARGYPGANEHPGDQQAWLTVATTRPETYLGDTAVAINPHDPRAKALRGLFVELPLVGRVIPVIEDAYVVLPERYARTEEDKSDPKAAMATGFLKVTPAHDPNDYEIGQRHTLAMINIFAPDASISDKHGFTDVGDARIFVGKKREEARKLVVKEFEARGLFEGSKPHRHSVKHSDRSKAIVEPYLSDQWYVKVTDARMAKAANAALHAARRPGVSPGTDDPTLPLSPTRVPDPSDITDGLSIRVSNLPHFEQGGSTYHVTFRLGGGQMTEHERSLVLDACRHFDGDRYELHAAVVMPDHVHLILSPFRRDDQTWHPLSEILHSIKSFTAHQIAKGRKASGPVWVADHFDRLIREGDEFLSTLRYVLDNPVRKGLVETWRGYSSTWCSEESLIGKTRFAERWKREFKHLAGEKRGQPVIGARRDAGPTGEAPLQFFPERYAKTYEHWHENIRDWCISRQLWWGHRIPVWTCDGMTRQAYEDVFLALTAGPLALPGDSVAVIAWKPGRDPRTGEEHGTYGMHVCVREADDLVVQMLERAGFTQDLDVLDTWFSSALWPLSTLGWPDPAKYNAALNAGLLEAFNPSSVLCTAREIITLWVSRMVMFNQYLKSHGVNESRSQESRSHEVGSTSLHDSVTLDSVTSSVPFHHVYIHAVIQDGNGQKMSKSLGNGVDPLDIIATHGADAMRFTLCHMATNTQDVRLPVVKDPQGRNTSQKFDLGRNFANKLWNASRFALSMVSSAGVPEPDRSERTAALRNSGTLPLLDRWMLSRLETGIREANEALAEYRFSDYAQTLYSLLWNDYCDWYLEGVKPTIASSQAQQGVLVHTLSAILRLLHPVMPFVTEAIWERLGDIRVSGVPGLSFPGDRTNPSSLLCTAGWPQASPSLRDVAAERQFDELRALVTAIRDVRAAQQVKPSRRITLHVPRGAPSVTDDVRALLLVFAGLESIDTRGGEVPHGAATCLHASHEYRLSNLRDPAEVGGDGAASKDAERGRAGKLVADLEKSVATLEGRLASPGYAERAPPAMVQQTREELSKKRAELEAARAALAKL